MPAMGDDGYACPGIIGAASYVGRLDFLGLAFLREGGGVESVLAILDPTASSSSILEALSSFGCAEMPVGGITDDSPLVDDTGMRTEL